jgi:xanthine/CO dehydrogenase XdhC/CoxF family maturation factor
MLLSLSPSALTYPDRTRPLNFTAVIGMEVTIGAQMAVSETGEYVGYLSGGCLERSVTTEALTAISEGRNRLVSYGKGSPYLDLQLPCGSTLDIYIDQSLGTPLVSRLLGMRSRRSLVALEPLWPQARANSQAWIHFKIGRSRASETAKFSVASTSRR